MRDDVISTTAANIITAAAMPIRAATRHDGSPPALRVADLSVSFGTDTGRLQVLKQLDFSLARGEIGCLLGGSGCGKTTALRAIAGFIRPDLGSIEVDGHCVSSSAQVLAPE